MINFIHIYVDSSRNGIYNYISEIIDTNEDNIININEHLILNNFNNLNTSFTTPQDNIFEYIDIGNDGKFNIARNYIWNPDTGFYDFIEKQIVYDTNTKPVISIPKLNLQIPLLKQRIVIMVLQMI